jgi:hypothetical protein
VAPRPLKDPNARPFGYVPPEGISTIPVPTPPAETKPDAGAEPGDAAPAADKPKDKPEGDAEKAPGKDKDKKEPEAEKDEPK